MAKILLPTKGTAPLQEKKSSGWDNVAVDIRQWQERKSCNVKMLLMHLLLPKAKTPLSSATT